MLSAPVKYIIKLISAPYALVLYLRHCLYDAKVLKSYKVNGVICIAVGNLSVGGSGKTPMVKFLNKIISQKRTVAILSRGYGRKSKGFYEVNSNDVEKFGDEALEIQMATNARVFVCEDRVNGANQIKKLYPEVDIILLDDALQHRRLNSDIKILLTTFQKPYYQDVLLPFGTLRDITFAAAYADFIIISKTPKTLPEPSHIQLEHEVPFQYGETAFYSSIIYNDITNPINNKKIDYANQYHIIGVSALANPKLFNDYLANIGLTYDSLSKPDHHFYNEIDCLKIQKIWNESTFEKKAVVCTEKDFEKLNLAKTKYGCNFDLYTLPISIEIRYGKTDIFAEKLLDLIKEKENIA